jgi:hypothetical protein
MKAFLTLLCVLFTVAAAFAQTNKLLPIDQAGWRMLNYNPEVTGSDTGRVYYKITLTKQGTVKRVTLLDNTFNAKTEKEWRNLVSDLRFEHSASHKPRKKDYTGTISISREWCNPELQGIDLK